MSSRDTRVLVISHGHPAFSLGGAEIASYNLHQGLNRLPGFESFYLARIAAPVARHRHSAFMSLRQKEREILFHTESYDHFRMSNRDTDAIQQDFIRFVRDLKPDIVHFHHFLGLGLECLFAIKQAMPQVPIAITFHEYLAICHHHGQMIKTGGQGKLCHRASPAECAGCFPDIPAAQFHKREAFLKTFLDLADIYVSPSHFLIDRYAAWGLPREKFRFIENGLDIGDIAPPRPLPPGGTGRRNRFAYFGQINHFKGLHVVLEAVGRVPEEVWGTDSQLMVFGGNLERQPQEFQDRFKRLVDLAGSRVRFYGSYQSSEMPTLMRNVDWTIVPSVWWENSPIVIQEAYLHKRPIICSDIGGMAEKIEDGVTGLHFRAGSVEGLVDRFVEVLTTPTLWDDLRRNIKQPLDDAGCAELHAGLYRELLDNRRTQSTAAPMPATAQLAAASAR
ncbi:MAG TPA: glycosyltransferase family 4 protein [Alphaproteobacteria bacterium]|nr:glycosyltransferase family 4 protein [Alphaproteobacteria bacterium]